MPAKLILIHSSYQQGIVVSKEIGSRKLGNQPTNCDLDYTDVSDFTVMLEISKSHL